VPAAAAAGAEAASGRRCCGALAPRVLLPPPLSPPPRSPPFARADARISARFRLYSLRFTRSMRSRHGLSWCDGETPNEYVTVPRFFCTSSRRRTPARRGETKTFVVSG
jgi:hypothetical protein